MRRAALILAAALCSVALLSGAPARAQAQGVVQVNKDPDTGRLVYLADLTGRQPGQVVIGQATDVIWFFNPLDPLQPGFGCRFILPDFFHLGFCRLPANGLVVELGPGPNDVRVLPTVQELPGPNLIRGNKKKDVIGGGQSDEKVKGGKGNDRVDPGDGEDDVNSGAQNDKLNTKDGEKDTANCGKGKRDVLKRDKKDEERNCEKVKPK